MCFRFSSLEFQGMPCANNLPTGGCGNSPSLKNTGRQRCYQSKASHTRRATLLLFQHHARPHELATVNHPNHVRYLLQSNNIVQAHLTLSLCASLLVVLSVCWYVIPSVCQPVSVRLSLYRLFVCSSLCAFLCLSVCRSVSLSPLSVSLSDYLCMMHL